GHFFPGNLVIGRLCNPDTSISTTPRQTERESWRSHIECRIIDKAASASDIVIPHQTVGGADFEHVYHVANRLEEFLFRHHPAHCGRRKEAEPLARAKVFGTIISKIEFREVTAIEIIGNPAGKPLIPERH